ncbi:hypothetical protein K438DRAFT_1980957 [Mycena galopus ATCC 62051]|nr:hypothetical protein K438DRAFT_1980957 [Mycena galopus ATCC 62051]
MSNVYIADILDLPYRLHQYGVEPAPCGSNAGLNISQQPVMFWFYQQQANGTEEARTVFCDPFMELYYVYASADLSSGGLTNVTMVHDYIEDNNITGLPFNNTPFNAVIFDDNRTRLFRCMQTQKFGAPGVIFQSALQAGLQSVFDQPSGFLNRTAKYYTMHLALAANSVIVDQPLPSAYPIGPPLCLWISQRVATPCQQAATAEPVLSCAAWNHCGHRLVTSRSGFGDLLLPYGDLAMMEKKLDGLRFQLDKRTGAILVDDYEPTGKSPSPSPGKLPLGELRS